MSVAVQTSGAFFPAVSGTGQAANGAPPLATCAGGTAAQASVSDRRQEKDIASYFDPSASPASDTRRAVRCPSAGESNPPGPAWNTYDTGSERLSALSTARTCKVCVPLRTGVTEKDLAVDARPVATFVHCTPSNDHSTHW